MQHDAEAQSCGQHSQTTRNDIEVSVTGSPFYKLVAALRYRKVDQERRLRLLQLKFRAVQHQLLCTLLRDPVLFQSECIPVWVGAYRSKPKIQPQGRAVSCFDDAVLVRF